jgi:hypothetical protein
MKIIPTRTVASLCLVLLSNVIAAPPALAACDRECLRSTMTAFLYALVKHDTSALPLAATVRVTEDGVEKALDRVSLVTTVTRLGGYRQDILDERAGPGIAGNGSRRCRDWLRCTPPGPDRGRGDRR